MYGSAGQLSLHPTFLLLYYVRRTVIRGQIIRIIRIIQYIIRIIHNTKKNPVYFPSHSPQTNLRTYNRLKIVLNVSQCGPATVYARCESIGIRPGGPGTLLSRPEGRYVSAVSN